MASFTYLVLSEFQALTIMPQVDITAVETETPGFTLQRLTSRSAWLNARLRKRYAAPFAGPPYPEAIRDWLNKLVTFELYIKRGVDPQDQSIAFVRQQYEDALAEVKEAADSKDGLFDLPLNDATATGDQSALAKTAPFTYAEQSPYTWTEIQRADGQTEDSEDVG